MRNRESGNAAIGVLALVGVILIIILITTCAKLVNIPPGYVGVSVKKCAGAKVDPNPVPVGYKWRELFCEEIIKYPTNLQTVVLTASDKEGDEGDEAITVSSKDGIAVIVDVSLSYTLDPAKVPFLYEKFRQDVSHLNKTFVRQAIREALQATYSNYTAEEIYSVKRETCRAEAQQYIEKHLGEYGFMVVQFTVNETRMPKQITDAVNNKVAMKQEAQRSEQEVAKKNFEAQQAVAVAKGAADARIEEARGEAEARRLRADADAYYNQKVSASITPSYLQYMVVNKWTGALPVYQGGNGPLPMMNIGK